jgi:transcriptional regulator with PAS, ATPase and Fis domain
MNALSPTAESIGTKIFGRRPRFKYSYDNIIGVSPPVQNLYELLDRIVETDHSVIIQGESGTGKELVANAIHFNGPRKNKPFIAENCAALSDSLLEAELFGYVKGAFTGADRDRKGFFEIANGGTLFLDEIGEMNIKMQKDLLRVLQEGEVRPVGGKKFITVDVRIICASNKDLRKLVSEGKFREDLYYRLDVMTIRVPSLRERKEDIPLLVEHFLSLISKETNTPRKKIGPGLVEALQRYDWPGNIRELKNELKRMLAICKGDTIQVTDFQYHDKLPILMNRGANGEQEVLTLDEMERRHILKVLDLVNGNKAKAAEVLGINRATIFRKIKKYDIEA